MSYLKYNNGASRWRVRYQWGPLRLVFLGGENTSGKKYSNYRCWMVFHKRKSKQEYFFKDKTVNFTLLYNFSGSKLWMKNTSKWAFHHHWCTFSAHFFSQFRSQWKVFPGCKYSCVIPGKYNFLTVLNNFQHLHIYRNPT